MLFFSHVSAAAAGFFAAALFWSGLGRMGVPAHEAVLVAVLAAIGAGVFFSRRAVASVRTAIDGLSDFVGLMQSGQASEVLLSQPEELSDLAARLRQLSSSFSAALAESSRKQAELSGVLASLVDGCIAVDPSGRVILFNQAASRLFGVRDTDVLGRPLVEAIRSYDLATAVGETLQSGQPQVREFRLVGTPGERTFQVTAAPLAPPASPDAARQAAGGAPADRARTPWGAVALVRDVTELRRLERVRSDFVANVSHELRTPLTAIKGFIEALQEGAAEDAATRTRFLEIMARETDRLVALINDLLDLSRLESRTAAFHPAALRLSEVAEAVVQMFSRKAGSKGLALSMEFDPGLPPVLGDEDMLRQVFINLLDNAIKYTMAGSIRVRARPERDGTVRVEVADTGIGIPRQHLSRIFERFYRVDRARSRELGGTGLGLSIVRHIVELHGGRIEVDSEVGVGTTFRFWLPAATSPAKAP
ncbi:ATP-binding protein [Carboxydochorda subterranea]|uniref:histidine kinase n=1 Tax=Carboxydichorda subterranea TaxID=3109565 RepID=A0ABZ1BUR3_9FIRM|nr:ATP-binding protein [Limnochorda sp. L945t]WRP16401.1 ATP-binding protein [Limnochorda sp. L945t]